MRPKVLVVFGTRPEAIKLAPVVLELQRSSWDVSVRLCVTAQHREMLDQVLRLFNLKVHHDLNIMQEGQSLEDVTCRVLSRMKTVLRREKPNLILVQGDTTTTFASALAGFYEGISVAHVEAGLRTWNKHNPFPEEINRVLASHVCDLHFAPTKQSRKNLLREGIRSESVYVTGNSVIDALLHVHKQVKREYVVYENMFRFLDSSKRMILVTGHRRESFGEGFRQICRAIRTIASKHPDVEVVYPVHLNPNVQKPVRNILNGLPNVHLLKPLEYKPFVFLMDRCYLILTDSGGVQEEAPSLGKPVLVMRQYTERPEGAKAGTVRLVGTREKAIVRQVDLMLRRRDLYRKMSRRHNPYGDGKSAARIVRAIHTYLRRSS